MGSDSVGCTNTSPIREQGAWRFRMIPSLTQRVGVVSVVLALALSLDQSLADETPATFDGHVKPFLAKYCVSCHGPTKQKGDRRFDELTVQIADDNALVDLQDIVDQLNLGEMPPPKEKLQPTDAERRQAIAWLGTKIEQYRREKKPALTQTTLRRLNSREYRNTIRDLLGLNMQMFDPTIGFPRDQTSEHLDNVGESLVTSGHLLQRYLAAADRIIEKVLTPTEKPAVQTWTFQDGFRQQPEIDQVHGRTNGFSWITLYDVPNADKPEGAFGPIWGFRDGAPYDGWYEMRFKAEALNRQHPYDRDFVGTDPAQPLRLGIVAGNIRTGPLHKPQPIQPLLAELDLADGEAWYTVRIWLDAGYTPRFTFPNGLMDARQMWGRLARQYRDQFPPLVRGGIVEHRFNSIKYGKLPQIHIDDIEIKGPFYDQWPPASQRAVLGDDFLSVQRTGTLSDEPMRQHLSALASRAFRRPVKPDEIDRLMKLIATRRATGRSPLEAYGDAVKAILCSPAFLYLVESGDKEESADKRLSSYALASRLSYFLWSSMPDEELLDLAATDKLRQPEVIKRQVQRMLKDSRASALVDGMLDSWLTLRDLGSMPPDRAKFDDYYRFDLQTAMREETRLFTQRLIAENLSVMNFLNSDFTYVNKPLASLYGADPPRGSGFELVKLNDGRRGGLLGQASVLTVTANGIDTSPVVRGVWLLENILGTPPSPPPPDVPPLDPDARGAKSIREQLEKHRSVASCYDCHRKIDPLGFALENFDAIGNWRENYSASTKIDAAGELPGGQAFDGIESFKKVLLERRGQFVTALTTKLLSYATGRRITPTDRPQVERIARQLAERGDGLRDLIELVATSEAFASK
jgi:Protein of unknown function (DUF1592)/Protein of unknown function (DUF1588)/Protein of unknown function (DUF1585)/Protein of unknown function (DUF1587)/Protein of unknown function (DUF1595)/Planctomycete cytochrome C